MILRQAWRELVQCQFHDSICGTCSDDVAKSLEVRFTDVEASANDIVHVALNRVVGHDPDRAREQAEARRPALVVWNPAARRRSGVTTAEITFFRQDVLVGPPGPRKPARGPGYKAFSLRNAAGETIPVQAIDVQQGLERSTPRGTTPIRIWWTWQWLPSGHRSWAGWKRPFCTRVVAVAGFREGRCGQAHGAFATRSLR